MDKSEWIEFAKVAAGVISGLVGVATVVWQVWRFFGKKISKLQRKIHDLEIELQKLVTDRDGARDRCDWYKKQSEALKNEHAKVRSDWKANFKSLLDERHGEYAAHLAQKDKIIEALHLELSGQRSVAEDLKRDVAELGRQTTAMQAALDQAGVNLAEARQAIERHIATEDALTQRLVEAKTQIEAFDLSTTELANERDGLVAELALSATERDQLQERLDSILKFDGKLWNLPVAESVSVPEFRPASNRKMPIVSVINFKGGVGKTSLTGNLAAYLGKQGKRSLMIDLDYQRSLSQLALTDKDRKMLQLQRRCLQHFLSGDEHGTQHFLDFAHRIESGMGSCWILPNSNASEIHHREESLDETENQLMAEWIVNRESKPDIRFFLREALHGTGIESHFDYVFLDCPPRLSTSTINALAASDYVLVPVLLDDLSKNSVGPLITALRDFRSLFPNLNFLGVVANQVKLIKGSPISRQAATWNLLRNESMIYKDYPVHFYETMIPENKAFGQTCDEDGPSLAINDTSVQKVFQNLFKEIQKEIASHEHSSSTAVLV